MEQSVPARGTSPARRLATAVRHCLVLAVASILAACTTITAVTPNEPEQRLVWPGPPLQPRIEWVREVYNQKGLGVSPGFWGKIARFVLGEKEERFIRPHGILADEQIFALVDSGAGRVHLIDLKRGTYRLLPEEGNTPMVSPIGIARDSRGALYVTDSGTGLIHRFSDDGDSFVALNLRPLHRPTGIAFNPVTGLLYVAETGAHRIVAFDSAGKETLRIGGSGMEPGAFNFPTDLAVMADGRLLVTDSLNSRIQIFTADGKPAGSFGEAGDTPGRFTRPKGVAVDSEGHIYVCDSQQDMVQIFDETGRLLLAFGDKGSLPSQFWMPSGIHIANDMIYVSDTYNQRVQVFRYLKEEPWGQDPHTPD